MAVSKVILHLGMHKTGTTAFQAFCEQNSDVLGAGGFLYPRAGRPELPSIHEGHHLLPWSLSDRADVPHLWPPALTDRQEVWPQLMRELEQSDCHTAILSSEEFETLGPNQVAEVANRLRPFEVTPVICLRRFDELLQAMYITDVIHHAEKRSLWEYFPEFPIPFSYYLLLEPWRQNFARVPLILFYTPETLRRASIVEEIATVIGLDLSGCDRHARARQVNSGRWPWYVVEVCRDMNARFVRSELVVKFAHIMHTIRGSVPEYDIMLPSEAGQLVASGVASLNALKIQRVVSEIPDHFSELPDTAADQRWRSIRANRDAAWSLVLNDIATLTDV